MKRNNTLDLLRALAVYGVVFIHFPFPGRLGVVSDGLIRISVPMFFLISGYLCYTGEGGDYAAIKKGAKRTAIRLLLATAFFTLWTFATYSEAELSEWLALLVTPRSIFAMVFLNWIPCSGHLWFMSALLYCYVFIYLVKRLGISDKLLLVYAFAALVLHQLLGEITMLGGAEVSIMRVRNAALTGFPFFALGWLINKHKRAVEEKATPRRCAAGIAAGVALTLLESVIFAQKGITGANDMFFGSIPLCVSLFLLAVVRPNALRLRALEWIGARLTFWIYNTHGLMPAVLPFSAALIALRGAVGESAYAYISPLAVALLSTAASCALYFAWRALKNLFRREGPQKHADSAC